MPSECHRLGQHKPKFCEEKQRLIDAFSDAASKYLLTESLQMQSVACGEGFSFEDIIKDARERKDLAKQALIAHQQEHGC